MVSVLNHSIDNGKADELKPGNVIEERTVAREYYNARYFYVQKRMQEEKDEGGFSLSTNKYARQVAYGHEYDSKVGNGRGHAGVPKSSNGTRRTLGVHQRRPH
jgi:hypothetical protein